MVAIGRRLGLRAARIPLEPRRVLKRIEPQMPSTPALLTALFARPLRRRVRAAGLLAPDSVFGLQWSGQMTKARLSGLLRNLPDGLSEIYLHPATGPFAGAAPGYRYREELDALMAPEIVAACRDSALRLRGFSHFLAVPPAIHSGPPPPPPPTR